LISISELIDEPTLSTFNLFCVDIKLKHNFAVLAVFLLEFWLREFINRMAPRALHLLGPNDKFKQSSTVVTHQSLPWHRCYFLSNVELTIRKMDQDMLVLRSDGVRHHSHFIFYHSSYKNNYNNFKFIKSFFYFLMFKPLRYVIINLQHNP
jgi:hypothetical protein